jgi:hypothetical protein
MGADCSLTVTGRRRWIISACGAEQRAIDNIVAILLRGRMLPAARQATGDNLED